MLRKPKLGWKDVCRPFHQRDKRDVLDHNQTLSDCRMRLAVSGCVRFYKRIVGPSTRPGLSFALGCYLEVRNVSWSARKGGLLGWDSHKSE